MLTANCSASMDGSDKSMGTKIRVNNMVSLNHTCLTVTTFESMSDNDSTLALDLGLRPAVHSSHGDSSFDIAPLAQWLWKN